ncbi:MAG: GAF domain-containing protein [Chloroflexi bacterium]|nr:GAF domain-containing sensor histidine kinase [Chloroflexota bacterium]MQC26368.1 GAF domain-containing protein [Chloroflexota bacterium]
MSNRLLKILAVVLPFGFMGLVIFFRVQFFSGERALEGNLYALVAVGLGATLFSIFIFTIFERREEETELRRLQLEALHEAAVALTTELDLETVLQKVVDLSRQLLSATYGALGVLEPDGEFIAQFITSGISNKARARIGDPPRGHGLLGVLSPGGEALIVNDIRQDPRSVGFPPNHPPMKSLLGVPIKSKGEIFGNLYVADKVDPYSPEEADLANFDEQDKLILEKFATQAAIAIENAQLYRQTRELAVLKERERFGMDLHDGIMQSVYATGLSLQEARLRLEEAPIETGSRLDQAIEDLGQVLHDIRNYILGLRPDRFVRQDLVTGLSELARELRANTLLDVAYDAPPVEEFDDLPSNQTAELLLITQEALTNVRKHAHARNLHLALARQGDAVQLIIEDDGSGFDQETAKGSAGNGLSNMRERAEAVNAEFSVESRQGSGTKISLQLPVKK